MRNNKRRNDRTRRYKVNKAKSSENESVKKNKNKVRKERKKHPRLKKFIIICFIICILLGLAGIGAFCGIFFSDKWKISKEDLVISNQNSIVYDKDGKKIAELTGDENRKIITISEMGEYLPNAFVAIEDERYYSHFGIDIKRTAGAIVTYVLNGGESSFGGSTITQQLVKNMMQDNASEGTAGVERKIREWSRAYQIEQMLSKTQILELYLNKIFFGSTVYGVESASMYYFNKPAKKLSLAQSAFLAGINHSPNSYNPFYEDEDGETAEAIKTRTKVVLSQMKKLRDSDVEELQGLKNITDEDFEKAIKEVEDGLKFKKGNVGSVANISYHTAAAIDQIAEQLAEEKEIKYDDARDMIKNNGYKIYTTQDSDIQDIIEKEYKKDEYLIKATTKVGKANKAHMQSGMVIIDHETGYVVGTVGGLGDDVYTTDLNRATHNINRQPGSAIKPLAAVGPALEEKVITAATIYDDSPTAFGGQSFGNSTGYPGLISVRAGIERSSNVVNMKVLSDLGINTSLKYLEEFGLSNYGDEDASITLALGGTHNGTNPLEMAAAYGAIARGGEYISPTFYTKLENSSGTVVLEPRQETRRVISEQTAYVLTEILNSPVYGFYGGATATVCRIPGIETSAKTGTTSEYKDKWTCGMTPYYSAAVWTGFDEPESLGWDNPAKEIWASVMKKVHKDLDDADFERPNGVVYATICKISGKVATDKCKSKYSEVFIKGTIPGVCEGHEPVKICKESKLLATEYCTNVEEKTYDIKPETERNPNWSTNAGKKYNEIKDTCKLHTKETMTLTVPDVVGKTEDIAKTELMGFTISVVFEQDSTKQNGVVLRQSLVAGETAKKGSAITITVNDITTSEEENTPPSTNENTTVEQNTVVDTNNTVIENDVTNEVI